MIYSSVVTWQIEEGVEDVEAFSVVPLDELVGVQLADIGAVETRGGPRVT